MVIEASEDAFGRALLDHLEGRSGPELRLEADDGSSRVADMQPADFFAGPEVWLPWEVQAVALATDRVLDLGAGAGRHALHLQDRGHDVTAVDASPDAVRVCRARGVREVRHADLRDIGWDERWDTVLLLGGNLGLAGDLEPTRRLLGRLAQLTTAGGLLIGDTVDPTSEDPDDVAYEARNLARGFHRGHVRLRVRYGEIVSPWWDQLNIAPGDLGGVLEGTGWALETTMGDEEGYAVVLRRVTTA